MVHDSLEPMRDRIKKIDDAQALCKSQIEAAKGIVSAHTQQLNQIKQELKQFDVILDRIAKQECSFKEELQKQNYKCDGFEGRVRDIQTEFQRRGEQFEKDFLIV